MGMFDEIRCEAPLPDSGNACDAWFQTKSFPEPFMRRYTITADGRLLDSLGNDLEPEGYITFYSADPDEGLREYRAHFQRGALSEIAIADDQGGRRFLGLASFRWFDPPSFLFGDPEDTNDEFASVSQPPPRSLTTGTEQEALLLVAIKSALPELQKLLERANSHWQYEDPLYRLYHMSFKVYHLQHFTGEIVAALRRVQPGVPLNEKFMTIVRDGSGRRFTAESNSRWLPETRPIVEAFFHARFFLEMAVRYGSELDGTPERLPSGYAALLYLYGLR